MNKSTVVLAHFAFKRLTISNIMTLAHKIARGMDTTIAYRTRLSSALKRAHKSMLVSNIKTGVRKLKTIVEARKIYKTLKLVLAKKANDTLLAAKKLKAIPKWQQTAKI